MQLTTSRGLRSTRETARHLEISDGGTPSVGEAESLRKTHLAPMTVAITATHPQYTRGVKSASNRLMVESAVRWAGPRIDEGEYPLEPDRRLTMFDSEKALAAKDET